MNKNFLFHILCVCFICTGMLISCDQEEDPIVLSEHLPLKYTLPQGDAEYDDRILEFYEKFGTFILYEYEKFDPFWNVESVLSGSDKYNIVFTPKEYLEVSVNTLFDLWLDLYSEEFMQGKMPRYLFLADSVWYWYTNILKPNDPPTRRNEEYTTTVTNIMISGFGENLIDMTDTEKSNFQQSLNKVFWTYICENEKFEAPEALNNIDFEAVMKGGNATAARNAGMFHGAYQWRDADRKYHPMTPARDVMESIFWLMKTSQTMIWYYLGGGGRYPGKGNYPLACQERCILIAEEMKRVYNIDLETLVGKELPKRKEVEE